MDFSCRGGNEEFLSFENENMWRANPLFAKSHLVGLFVYISRSGNILQKLRSYPLDRKLISLTAENKNRPTW